MFCQVKSFAKCKEIAKVRQSLYLSEENGENWLNECQICISPCGSLLVFARGQRMITLNTQWDSSSNMSSFVETWNGNLPTEISSLLALQISSGESRSGCDWICIVVGFKTGEIGFYNDQGQLLLSDKLDDTPVLKIKCYTGQHGSETDEVYILYANSVCCLAASNVLQALRHAKLQLAKVNIASVTEPITEGQNLLTRKLGFVGQDVVCDASVTGLELSNTFDHLLTASIHGGFFTSYRSVAPHNTVVVGVGARPYVGFHQALEGGSAQPLLNDVARAVASKIKSALPGWLVGAKSRVESPTVAPLPIADRMICRYYLADLHRKGLSAITSPDRRLLAVVDSLGRVLLIDVKRGVAVRMFKGYRNSQCGFLQVNEESSRRKGPGKRALFIVLYVGKHGLLEVWPLRGPRIAAFSVPHNAHLLYYSHNVLQQGNRRSSAVSIPTLALLNPDGQIKHITVPFHFALNTEDSDRSRDVHLVKRLRQIIKEKEYNFEQLKNETLKTTKELKTIEIKIHCLEMMIANKNIPPEVLLTCIKILYIMKQNDEESTAQDLTKLNTMCENLYSLLLFYIYTNTIEIQDDHFSYEPLHAFINCENNEKTPLKTETDEMVSSINDDENSTEIDEQSDNKSIEFENSGNETIITESELINLQHLLNLAASTEIKKAHHVKVKFLDEKKSVFSEFLLAFNILSNDNTLLLKESLSDEVMLFVSQQIFERYLLGELEWKVSQRVCSTAKLITPDILCRLLLVYWMHLPVQEITNLRMERFGNIMLEICRSAGLHNIYRGYNETSCWWEVVRDFLVDSSCPFRSMVSAQLCRAVAQKIEKEEEGKQNDLDEGLWENVSKDDARWGLLVGKLDDISLLSIMLTQKPEIVNKLPTAPIELPNINLKYIYNKGKGSISELTAIWLCTSGIDPNDIVANYKGTCEQETQSKNNEKKLISVQFDVQEKNGSKIEMTIFGKLNLLKKQFPFSLNCNNLVTNMCWEYVKFWSQNIEEMTYLEASLSCLKSIIYIPLRCGICTMIWSTYLVYPFESACKLISKVGKLPREKLTRQNVGLSDIQLLKFLQIINEFLDLFLCSALSTNEEETYTTRFEEMWEQSSPALTELALVKSNVNVEILQLHYQLSAAIYYQCFLGSNFWKHLSNLFDVESQKTMFGSLNNSSDLTFHHQLTDSRVMIHRNNFLSRLVQKCVELAKERDLWIERVQDLARLWRVNDDNIRRVHVICLYAQGLDNEAEEAIVSVTDLKPLLDVLIPIAGRRLKHFVDCVDNRAEVISVLSPRVTTYLQSLEEVPNELLNVTSLESTCRLLQLVINQGEQRFDNNLYKIGCMLLDGCLSIQNNLGIGK